MDTVSVPYQKVDARFQFTADNDTAERLSDTFNGQFHLFEHVYSDDVHFWYGVAHIECTYEQFREPMRVAGGPVSICVSVELSDGRTGAARVQYVKNDVDGTIFLSLVGFTSLRKPGVSRRMRKDSRKGAVPELKQSSDLTLDDFRKHPVWIGCHGADYDEPWYDDTDEATFRPRTGDLPADPSEGMLLVRATAVLADGSQLAGFITPAFDEGDMGTLQPLVFVNGQQFSFWGGMSDFARDKRTSFYEGLAKNPEQIFPMRIVADAGLTRGVQVAEVRGFYKMSGDDIDVER